MNSNARDVSFAPASRPATPIPSVGDVLLVDDDQRNLIAIEAALAGVVPRVVRAHSGEEALRKLLERDFALILLDIQMPSMDGFKTASLIRQRERCRRTPIIFITAFSRDDHEILRAYALGAVDFLFKPIVPELLRAKASVFVELLRERAEVARQSELLREHERREHERAFAEERRRWEEQTLRVQVDEERRLAAEQTRRAEELSRLVAEQQRAEQELTRINRELAEVDRRKDEFLAVLAHELRNPLAPLLHGLELLRMHLQDGDVAGRLSAILRTHALMERQILHLRRLVDDLLDLSRINLGKIELRREKVEIAEVIRQAIATSRGWIDDHEHKLDVLLPEETIPVEADSVRMVQVIANLLNNAARYTPPGGAIRLSCTAEAGMVAISVSDNGKGIDPELLPYVFDMFVQGGRGGDGLGLGLTLVRLIAEMHGGNACAQSGGPGLGSTFTVWLPALCEGDSIPAEPLELREAQHMVLPEANPSLRVVVVDDHPDIRLSLRELLHLWGHSVDVACDGEEGVELIVRSQPDVALVDISMPKLDGFELARRVREALPGAKIRLVAMTGFGQNQDRDRALAAGFDLHIVKPATRDALREVFAQSPH